SATRARHSGHCAVSGACLRWWPWPAWSRSPWWCGVVRRRWSASRRGWSPAGPWATWWTESSAGRSWTSSTSGSGRLSTPPTRRSRWARYCWSGSVSRNQENVTRIEVNEDGAGRRLDVVVAEGAGVSRSRAGELVSAGAVSVDGRVERKSYRVSAGDVIDVGSLEAVAVAPPDGVRVAYSDDDVLVV